MRLTCPDCGARYEIADEMIPDNGRDVQCSNCDATWFQVAPPRRPAAVKAFPGERGGEKAEPSAPPSEAPPPEATPSEAPPSEATGATLEERHAPDVLATLREEREFEMQARAVEQGEAVIDIIAPDDEADPVLEYEDDTDASRRSGETGGTGQTERARIAAAAQVARSRVSRPDGADVVEGEATEVDPDGPPRRRGTRLVRGVEALPAIAPDDAERLDDVATTNRQRSKGILVREDHPARLPGREARDARRRLNDPDGAGFRVGFLSVLALAAVAALAYAFSADIASEFPALADPLTAYVAVVDDMRGGLEGAVARLTRWLEGLTAG